MAYACYDFSESISRANVGRDQIERVRAAFGHSPEGGGSWEGGFVFKMKDGRWGYLTGWCDYTGWGCQDGIEMTWLDTEPDLATLKQNQWNDTRQEWDLDPVDLNRFVRGEIDEFA